MTSSPSQAPAAGKSPSTVPDGLALFRHWLETEGAKGWDALDTAPDSGYEKVWRAWLRSLRSEEHTSELQSRQYLVCRLLLEKKKQTKTTQCVTNAPSRPTNPTLLMRTENHG